MTIIHRLLAWLVHLIVVPFFLTKAKLRAGLASRFWWRTPATAHSKNHAVRVWAHGASAGDVLCLQPLLLELEKRLPLTVTITALTESGVAMAKQRFPNATVAYQPLDLPGATARATAHIKPDLLLLERAELWPALIRSVHSSGAVVAVANGLISANLVATYRRLFRLLGNVMTDVDLFMMRTQQEAERAVLIGGRADRVVVTGNTKLDSAAVVPTQEQVEALGQQLDLPKERPVFIAGSTHRGEEELVAHAFAQLLKVQPSAVLLVAPRYLERCDEVETVFQQKQLAIVRRSHGKTAGSEVILLDTLGELGRAYGLARVAFVGGSLVPRGGQNMLEPAALGVPVLVGKHTEHSRDQVALLSGQGLTEVVDGEALTQQLLQLMTHPEQAAALGQAAQNALKQGLGASARCADHLVPLLQRKNPG